MSDQWNGEDREYRDPCRYYSESAYTAPAEELRRRRQGRKRVVWGTVFALLFISVLSGLFYVALSGMLDEEETGLSRLLGTVTETDLLPREGEGLSREGASLSAPVQSEESEQGGGTARIDLASGARRGEGQSAQSLYEQCAPSVVALSCLDENGQSCGYGSGVLFTEDGCLVTNAHVLSGAESVTATLYDGRSFPAELMGSDSASGLAVLRIRAEGLQAASFSDLSGTEPGSELIAIGCAIPGSLTVSDGLLSAQACQITVDGFPLEVLQTTAYSGTGCSGGALINRFGQVVGILNSELTARYDLGNVALALPMSVVKPIAEELAANGYVAGRPSTGLQLSDIPLSAAAFYGLPEGVFVESVFTGADAYEKGVSRGDIILSADGETVTSVEELNAVVNRHAVGDVISIELYRGREVFELEITLIDLDKMLHEYGA